MREGWNTQTEDWNFERRHLITRLVSGANQFLEHHQTTSGESANSKTHATSILRSYFEPYTTYIYLPICPTHNIFISCFTWNEEKLTPRKYLDIYISIEWMKNKILFYFQLPNVKKSVFLILFFLYALRGEFISCR